MTSPLEVRSRIVATFRRDLIGPDPGDVDLANERLNENPSRWYLAGFLAPAEDELALDGAGEGEATAEAEELELDVEEPDADGAGGAAGDNDEPEAPNARRRFLPSSIGLTVLLNPDVRQIKATVSWGDYRTEPPMEEALLQPDPPAGEEGAGKKLTRPPVEWVRVGKSRTVPLDVLDGRAGPLTIPESASEQRPGGGLCLETHSRVFNVPTPDGGSERVRALTVFLVNRRDPKTHRRYADLGYAFQARLELTCDRGFQSRRDLSGLTSNDPDLRLADLHYRDVCEWAVGRNAAAAWSAEQDRSGKVDRVWTDPLPLAEVERVAPNEGGELTSAVVFEMETLAELAGGEAEALRKALEGLPDLYGAWIANERSRLGGLPPRRRATGDSLVADMEAARGRIAEGVQVLVAEGDPVARRLARRTAPRPRQMLGLG